MSTETQTKTFTGLRISHYGKIVPELERMTRWTIRKVSSVAIPAGKSRYAFFSADGTVSKEEATEKAFFTPTTTEAEKKFMLDHNIRCLASDFTFTTEQVEKDLFRPELNKKALGNRVISGKFENYADFDVIGNPAKGVVPTFGMRKRENKTPIIPPRVGDYVCGEVPDGSYANKATVISFDRWFVCSQQFMQFWRAVLLPFYRQSHPGENVCDTLWLSVCQKQGASVNDQVAYSKWLFSGNRLCANTHRKTRLGYEQNGLPVPDLSALFYKFNTERASIEHVHIYAALAKMFSYGTIPSDEDVPRNLDDRHPSIKNWDLPAGWIDCLAHGYDLRPIEAQITVDVHPVLKKKNPVADKMEVAEHAMEVVVEPRPTAPLNDAEFPVLSVKK